MPHDSICNTSRRPPCKNESRHDGFQNRNLLFQGAIFRRFMLNVGIRYVDGWLEGGWTSTWRKFSAVMSFWDELLLAWMLWDSYPPIKQKEVHWIFTMPRSIWNLEKVPVLYKNSEEFHFSKAFKIDIDIGNFSWILSTKKSEKWQKWTVPFFS